MTLTPIGDIGVATLTHVEVQDVPYAQQMGRSNTDVPGTVIQSQSQVPVAEAQVYDRRVELASRPESEL